MIRVEIYKDEDSDERFGMFLVPDNASKRYLERNLPYLIHASQILLNKAEPWRDDKETNKHD